MAEGCLTMSMAERDRSHLDRETLERKLAQRVAAERLVRRFKQHGDAGLVNRQRGRASNNRLAASLRQRIEQLLRDTYPDLGPTLAAEKLAERDAIVVSRGVVARIGKWEAPSPFPSDFTRYGRRSGTPAPTCGSRHERRRQLQ
jgi:hypothetical protein